MPNYHIPLLPSEAYHVFSRAIGNEKLFLNEENYYFFLQKLSLHLLPVCEIYTYSLLPNHFHLLVRILPFESLIVEFERIKGKSFDDKEHSISDFVMERFSNLLNSYTKAFNKVNRRKGALFMDYLKRSSVNRDEDFTNYIFYIHKNAVHHSLATSIGSWKFDGYNSILSNSPTLLLREEVLEWFGGRERFIKFHSQNVELKNIAFEEFD